LFGAGALAEVDITANLSTLDGQRIHGSIDRLIFEEGAIYCIDFKTNKTVPNSPAETPEGLLRQMGAYVEALEQIYPDHKVFPQILWTQTGYLMDLPRDLVISALQNTSSP
jgi:ATP-dependent helicase/nuclease subunit A